MNPFHYFLYQFELLQLENYELGRYLRLIKKSSGAPKTTLRQTVQWTTKAKAIFLLSFGLHALVCGIASMFIVTFLKLPMSGIIPVFLTLFIVLLYVFYIFLALAVFLLSPIDYVMKQHITRSAKRKLLKMDKVTIIGISGSYGKTTMKEVVATILAEKYNVLKTPESVNTPVGIGRLILQDLSDNTEIFVVELGEHYPGDIQDLCRFVTPSIGLITGINESHLERLGTLENTVRTIFELAENMKPDGTLLLNADDNLIVEHYKRYMRDQSLQFYSAQNSTLAKYQTKNEHFDEATKSQSFEVVQGSHAFDTFTTSLLGHYIIGDIIAGIIVATQLGLTTQQIKSGITKLQPVPHRLQPVPSASDVVVIDDSYNGNPQGVKEAIDVLAKFTLRRKIFLTPGLVEMGVKSQEIHYNIGKQLANVANLVILIRNSVTENIEKGLLDAGFSKDNIRWFDEVQEAHDSLKGILQRNDVILFQNDWTDNYL